jgi:thiamine biosynthesis lipoprotein
MMRAVYRGATRHALDAPATVVPATIITAMVVLAAVVLAAVATGCRERAAPGRFAETRRFMAVPWTVTVHAATAAGGRKAIAAAFAEIARVEAILSDYDPASELSRLSAAAPMAEPVPVGDDLWRVLVWAAEIRDATAGAFDVTVGPLTTVWRRARRSGRLPPADTLAAARAAVGADALLLDREARTVRLTRPGMRLDAGGIGRGYALDRALEVLTAHGITAAMIDCSGDVVMSGPPPGAAGWRIAIRPFAGTPAGGGGADERGPPLLLTHAAVTTSGDAYQFVEIDGVRYSHVVDPRTGLGVTGRTAVTVIAPDATTADALATALSVLGPDAGLEALAAFPECAARFAWIEDGRPRRVASPTWPHATDP